MKTCDSPVYRIPEPWFARPADELAAHLLGKRLASLVDGRLVDGLIVETEAYLPEGDTACHATRGRTPGNSSMFGPAGRAYVYPIHSRVCFNVVSGQIGEGTAVLIRGLEPRSGIATMRQRRGGVSIRDLCRGPARLCQALGISRDHDGHDLSTHHMLWIDRYHEQVVAAEQIRRTERIGVTSAREHRLRFVVAGCSWASGPARMR
jgi:DNA-3-methyladenine glycosylase